MSNLNKPKTTKQQVIKALQKNHGFINLAAEALGISRSMLQQRIHRNPELQKIRDEARNEGNDEILDISEANYFAAARAGNLKASGFILRHLGKARGYGNEMIIHSDNVNQNIELEKVFSVEELREMRERIIKNSNNTDSNGESVREE